MSRWRENWATVCVLWWRDVQRFYRQPTRLMGALGQPIIFWLIIGNGMAGSFHVAGSALDYPTYFYPGVVLMVGLFASIFASVSLIEDRQQGFMQAVLVAPGARLSLVLGKCLGSTTVALMQMSCFLLLAPFAGFAWQQIDWGTLLTSLLLITFGLAALGFALAWWLHNSAAYHAVQMTLLMPLWVLSGAMFPLPSSLGSAAPSSAGQASAAWVWLSRLNPFAYAVSAIRAALTPSDNAAALQVSSQLLVAPLSTSLLYLGLFAAFTLLLASWASRNSQPVT